MTASPYILPAVIGTSIVVILLIYWIGGKIGRKRKDDQKGHRDEPYACGEEFPAKELEVDLENFFIFAIYLLVFDVLILMLGTSASSLTIGPIIYSLVVIAASAMLVAYREVI
jgi:NADH:ubiquinone oxidoreductase subunit 3 (subunit A)